MKKTELYAAVAAYILKLDAKTEMRLTKEEKEHVRKVLTTSVFMLDAIHEPIEVGDLDIVLACLISYIAQNGKKTKEEKFEHLNRIVNKTTLILSWHVQHPISEVLDYVHGKKHHFLQKLLK